MQGGARCGRAAAAARAAHSASSPCRGRARRPSRSGKSISCRSSPTRPSLPSRTRACSKPSRRARRSLRSRSNTRPLSASCWRRSRDRPPSAAGIRLDCGRGGAAVRGGSRGVHLPDGGEYPLVADFGTPDEVRPRTAKTRSCRRRVADGARSMLRRPLSTSRIRTDPDASGFSWCEEHGSHAARRSP